MGNIVEKNRDVHIMSGIGFSGLLAIAFIVLKLTNVINWNWWWVLFPLWYGPALLILVLLIIIIVAYFEK